MKVVVILYVPSFYTIECIEYLMGSRSVGVRHVLFINTPYTA
jgi:hypothetical protein